MPKRPKTTKRYLYSLVANKKISWFSYSLPVEHSLKVAIPRLPVALANPSNLVSYEGPGGKVLLLF